MACGHCNASGVTRSRGGLAGRTQSDAATCRNPLCLMNAHGCREKYVEWELLSSLLASDTYGCAGSYRIRQSEVLWHLAVLFLRVLADIPLHSSNRDDIWWVDLSNSTRVTSGETENWITNVGFNQCYLQVEVESYS